MGVSLTNTMMTLVGILALGAELIFQSTSKRPFRCPSHAASRTCSLHVAGRIFNDAYRRQLADNDGLAFLPTVVLFFAGICTTFSRRVENILGLEFVLRLFRYALSP
jgi:hypothetical protein